MAAGGGESGSLFRRAFFSGLAEKNSSLSPTTCFCDLSSPGMKDAMERRGFEDPGYTYPLS